MDRIEHIAALTTRSSSNMPADYDGIPAGAAAKYCGEILLLKARLAAESSDEPETLRLVNAAVNLISHYREVENTSLYHETVVILTDLSLDQLAFNTLLPAIGRHADLGRWKAALGKRRFGTAELADVMRGEWNTSAEYMLCPTLLAAAANHQLSDPEATAHATTAWFNTCVTRLPASKLADLAGIIQAPVEVSHLSREGREVVDSLGGGTSSWLKGYVRAAAIHAQYQAALDLLILQKAGATLTAADAGRVTRDPLSGAPFEFDAAKRELCAPPDTAKLDVKPLPLPW